MSTTFLRLWEEYRHLSAEDRREFFDLLRSEPDKLWEFIEPTPMRPPGYFDGIDTPEEIAEENKLAKHSVADVPHNLD